MKIKRGFLISTIVLTAILLCGCFGGHEVGELAFVQIMGIEKKLDVYTVSMQLFQPSGSGSPSSSGENSVCISGEGNDLNSAISVCEVRSGKKIFLGHLKSVIIGDGIDSPSKELNTLIELRSDFGTLPLSCPVFYSKAPYEIASLIPKQGLYSAEHLTDLISRNAGFGNTFYEPISDILNAELHPLGSAVLPEILTDGKDAEFYGAKVNNDSLSDIKLTDEQLKGFLIFADRSAKNSKILVGTKNGDTVEIIDSKSHVTAEDSNGKLRINADIMLRLKMSDSISDKPGITTEVCTAVRDNCISAYSETAWENGIDAFGIYSEVRKSCPELLGNNSEKEFRELLKNSVLSIRVSALSS